MIQNPAIWRGFCIFIDMKSTAALKRLIYEILISESVSHTSASHRKPHKDSKSLFEAHDPMKLQEEVLFDAIFDATLKRVSENPEIVQMGENYDMASFDQQLEIASTISDAVLAEASVSISALARVAKRIQSSWDEYVLTTDSWEKLICRMISMTVIRGIERDDDPISSYRRLRLTISDLRDSRLKNLYMGGFEWETAKT